jgi:putative redox protein
MAEVSVQWLGGQRYVGIDSTKHAVVVSTSREGVGVKPTELMLIALAACSAVSVVDILHKKQQKLSALDIKVAGEQDAEPPWTFRKIHLDYTLRGKDLTDVAVQRSIELAEDKYCPVAATMRDVAAITHSYQIVEDDDAERTDSRQ